MSQVNPAVSEAIQPSLTFLNQLTSKDSPRDYAVRFWDGTVLEADAGQPTKFTLVLKHPGSVRQMFWPFNKASTGEAYIYDDMDIEGDINAFLDFLMQLQARNLSSSEKVRLLFRLLTMPNIREKREGQLPVQLQGKRRSRERDRKAIAYHYDAPPTEFFRLFLDPWMQYTCAYFEDPNESVDVAQERKLDYVCRKLRLKPGERLVDFGCGWGGLITFAAKNYGVETVGVTLSKKQFDSGNQLIQEMGLQKRCRIDYMDFREFPETEKFDKVVSIGFAEHIGPSMMPIFFGKVWNLLKPNGLYLHHAITLKPFVPFPSWRTFALKYVFPDGELVPITETLKYLAASGFEIRDTESLREHYIYTLENWLSRLESEYDQVKNLMSEVTYRIYRLYFAGSIRGFRTGLYNIYQTVVCKSENEVTGLPLTRNAWYE